MPTISATAPSIGDTLAQLISGGSGGSLTPAAASADSASSSTAASTGNSGPATVVTLSDQAKATIARAQSDQVAADSLQAYVEAHRATDNAAKGALTGSLQSILDASNPSPATQPTDPQPTTGAKVATIVAQITTLADANQPQPLQTFTPTRSLSNSVTVDGFTLTLGTNASTQYYGIELSGNGVQAYSKHFGPSAGGGGATALPPGVGIGSAMVDNNEALDSITLTQNIATASSASSSSSAGSISTSSVNAQSSSITFLVNYATGQISVEQSAASLSAQSTRVGSPGSTLSTLA